MLNAFRHQRFDTRLACGVLSRACTCSTPFGIRDSTPMSGVIWNRVGSLCSTPFGIRDSTPEYKQKQLVCNFRAQRLSASEIRHNSCELSLQPPLLQCSTPFGIRDSTPRTDRYCDRSSNRAQRLSASEIRHDHAAAMNSLSN